MNRKRTCWEKFRYWLFKDSESIEQQTKEFSRKVAALKKASAELNEEVAKVTQEDALRSLVISMSKAGRRHQ